MSRMVSFFVLIGIILFILVMFYRVMAGFLLPLFLAVLLVVIFNPLHHWILDRCRGRNRLAAGLTTLAVLLVVLIPVATVLYLAVVEASGLARNLQGATYATKLSELRERLGLQMPYAGEVRSIESAIENLVEDAREGRQGERAKETISRLTDRIGRLGRRMDAEELGSSQPLEPVETALQGAAAAEPGTLDYESALTVAKGEFRTFQLELYGGPMWTSLKQLANPTEEDIQIITARVFSIGPSWVLSVGGATGGFLVRLLLGAVIMVVAMYFFLADGPAMIATFMRLSPLDDRYENELLDEFDRISRAVVLATLLSAVVQGLLAGIGFYFADVGSVFLLILLTTVFAMIPFVGAAAVWLPASLWLFFVEERTLAAALLAIYGAAIVSTADNVIKPLVLHGQSNLHPLLTLLSVLGGVQAIGPIGILVGPMVVAFLQTLLNILHRELTTMETAKTAEDGGG